MDERSVKEVPMSRFKAVLLDFDGVVARTLEDNCRAWQFAMARYGVRLNKSEYFALEGYGPFQIAKTFCRNHKIPLKCHGEIAKMKEGYYKKHNKLAFYAGVNRLIKSLKMKKILIGLVTGCGRERLTKNVSKQFLEKFNVIITPEMTEKSKPFPEPYLKAAQKLRVKPKDCVVVENAPLGIRSAKRAGMHCIAVCSTLNKRQLNEADLIVKEFNELNKGDMSEIFR